MGDGVLKSCDQRLPITFANLRLCQIEKKKSGIHAHYKRRALVAAPQWDAGCATSKYPRDCSGPTRLRD
jgi:hypothetical protein